MDKKIGIAALAAIALLAGSVFAYMSYGGYGPSGGRGYGMMGPGYGMGGMMGGYGGYGADYKKFLDETATLRKQLNEKRFEYFEALRDPNAKPETLTQLEKEIVELENKIYEKAPRSSGGRYSNSQFWCPMAW